MKCLRLACVVGVMVACSHAWGNEPQIGDSVVVITDRAEVTSKEGSLGTVPVGTQFLVKQKSGAWLLGQFQIEGRTVWGWMRPSAVRALPRDISQQPVHEFTWHNLLLARAKLDTGFHLEDHAVDYMEAVRHDVWRECRNDEFQLERKRIETLALIQQRLAEFDVERDFMIKTSLTFQGYDFQGAKFPVKEATSSNYWYEYADYNTDDLPGTLKVFLNDPGLISGLPMDPAKAEPFLANRKSRGGYINREIFANIRVRLTGVRSSGELEADVRWAQFFSDSKRTRLLYETPQSPLQLPIDKESDTSPTLPTAQAKPQPTAQSAMPRIPVPSVKAFAIPTRPTMTQPAPARLTFPVAQANRPIVGQPFQSGQS